MKRVAVILGFPPSVDNMNWPTALPYWLLRHRPADVELHLSYFRLNEDLRTEWDSAIKDLDAASVTELQPFHTRWEEYAIRVTGRPHQDLPPQVTWFPVRREVRRRIRSLKPDVIWLYPHWLTPWVSQLEADRIVVTGPDSGVMIGERAIRYGGWKTPGELKTRTQELEQYWALETQLLKSGATIHVVGEADARRYEEMAGYPGCAKFTVHPHFRYSSPTRSRWQPGRTLRVVLSGNPNAQYLGDHRLRIVQSLIERSNELRGRMRMHLVGPDWDAVSRQLNAGGISAQHSRWVDDFSQLLADSEIALCPYAVGGGTKCKVLHAMASGTLAIGSKIAFENVQAMPDRDYLVYDCPEEAVEAIVQVLDQPERSHRIADAGCASVRSGHAPGRAAQDFWTLCMGSNDLTRSDDGTARCEPRSAKLAYAEGI